MLAVVLNRNRVPAGKAYLKAPTHDTLTYLSHSAMVLAMIDKLSRFVDCPQCHQRIQLQSEPLRLDGRLVVGWEAGNGHICMCGADLQGLPITQIRMRALTTRKFKVHAGGIWFCIPGCVTAGDTECNCPCEGACHGIGHSSKDEFGQIIREGSKCPGHSIAILTHSR